MNLMVNKYPRFVEILIAVIGVLLGFVVAVLLSLPIDRFFVANLLDYWGSQLCVLVLLLPFRPRLTILGGVAAALAFYLWAFNLWFFSIRHCDAMGWLGYFFSLPGAAIGALYSIFHLRKYAAAFPSAFIDTVYKYEGKLYSALHIQRNMSHDAVTSSFIAACYTLAGIFINLTVECMTIFYCFC